MGGGVRLKHEPLKESVPLLLITLCLRINGLFNRER